MIINHILYSYRRCPYAMRARMALISAGIVCDVYEVDFKSKPDSMLEISPKGTVPVLKTIDGLVYEESLDIMYWALEKSDPHNWLVGKDDELIRQNDGSFKQALDRYKYPSRFPDEDCSNASEEGLNFLRQLDDILSNANQLKSDEVCVTDIAIFPFIRQFSDVDKAWFETQEIPHLKRWLGEHIQSDMFQKIIQKHDTNPYSLL